MANHLKLIREEIYWWLYIISTLRNLILVILLLLESEDDDEDDDDIDIDFSDAPSRPATEPIKEYFDRTKDYWLSKAKEYCEAEEMTLSDKKLEKLATEMCQESFS